MEININNLKKKYGGKTAVDISAFNALQGQIIGLLGNNGAGKTTLFRLMLDLTEADEGNVSMTFDTPTGNSPDATLHVDPSESEEWKRYTGAYIDESFLIDFLTPEEYFGFVGRVCDMSKEQISQRLEYFSQFMAGEILGQKKYIREFSAGNKQKIGIIAAMFNRPQLLILDEPFNFLDPSSQMMLKRLITDYNSENGATVFISSHNLQNTTDISTRVILLEHGAIIKDMQNSDGSAEKELDDYFRI
jgi:ABC-2 type transport system ATP-binding protein